ncbi:hypothetical protein FACS1894184_09080 [Clostridia bacterium]|nr:hypothetical protein FACS1894184_09080 [Clostridia bacterium]
MKNRSFTKTVSKITAAVVMLTLIILACLPAFAAETKPTVINTTYPTFDFVREIAGDLVENIMLLPPGSESHSFEPTPRDIISIGSSDLFIYAGGESDVWISKILDSMDGGPKTTLALVGMVDAVEEEIVEGMEHEHDEDAFDPASVKDRPMTDFDGNWKTILPYVMNGQLNDYIQKRADSSEVSFEEMLETTKYRLRSDFDVFSVRNGVVTINGISALYTYAGFRTTDTSAWYSLKLADGTPGMPIYIAFNDHSTGNAEDAHDHDSDSVAHTHFRYGDDLDALMAATDWSTFYVDADADAFAIKLTMLGLSLEQYIDQGVQLGEEFLIEDRPTLADWYGDWQSVYPLIVDNTLDEVWEHKNEADDAKTAQEYKEAALYSYNTDVDRLVIKGDSITFIIDGSPVTARYEYAGQVRILEGNKWWVRYAYRAAGERNNAPLYVFFSDHEVQPTDDLEHFHLYMGDDYDELYNNSTIYPTYYPSAMSGEEVADEMIGHGSGEHSHDHESEEAELDEHVWTSPKNAKLIVAQLTEQLAQLDPANAGTYRANASAYLAKLDGLDAAFQNVVYNAVRKTVVFGDRFPFRYLADAYGLTYYAAFSGCSTETEASAATIKFLIDKVNDESVPVVFHIELSSEKIADAICEETGATKLLLHAVHNVTKSDFDDGIGYLELMTRNIDALKEALN